MIDIIQKHKLCDFLIQAKQNTYAKQGERAESKCILSKNYLYTDGEFRYEDQYFGEYLDVGEEIVWYNGIPIWGMGYRGGMVETYRELHSETFIILRKALLLPDYDCPTRGPSMMNEGEYVYYNKVDGDITSFIGYEWIEKNKEKIYFRNYIGGFIFGKNNKNMIICKEGDKIEKI